SGKAIARLVTEAQRLGVELREGVAFARLLDAGIGIMSTAGEKMAADRVVLALGAWTPHALPRLAAEFRSTGHPVFHLAPRDRDAFLPERFPVFCAEIQTTGYYGFPAHPENGVVKIARHGAGRPMHPESAERFAWRPGLYPARWEEATRSQTCCSLAPVSGSLDPLARPV